MLENNKETLLFSPSTVCSFECRRMDCLIKTWHIDRQLAHAVTWVIEQKMDFYSAFHMPCLQKPSQRSELEATDFLGLVAGTAPSASIASCTKRRVSSPVGILQKRNPTGPEAQVTGIRLQESLAPPLTWEQLPA